MYESFWSLEDAPFVLTPDPRFLLRARGHHEALSTLLYGITSQKGLMALIGDVGTGKTTLCRALVAELPDAVESALVLNPHLSPTELLGVILDDLGIERRGATKGELMTSLSQHLLAAGEAGTTVVVILDEAQQLSVEALEQIRILSNLETPRRKLLQVVLCGQPELETRLARRELRQLDQRIALRCHLAPLSRRDTYRYVEHRLRVAGLSGELPFTRGALARIYAWSGGVPRVINMVCDRALMAAWSARAREVTPSLVASAIRSLRGGWRRGLRARGARARWRRSLALAAVGGLVVTASVAAHRAGWLAEAGRLVPFRLGYRAPAALEVEARGGSPSGGSPLVPVAAEATATLPPPLDETDAVAIQLLQLWGVSAERARAAAREVPAGANGGRELPRLAERHQLAATYLAVASLPELRAIGLPALVEIDEWPARRPYLLRRAARDALTLLTPSAETVRLSPESFEARWTGSAWLFWRNPDGLPISPDRAMTAEVAAAVARRLQHLGRLSPPLPGSFDGRLEQAVRRLQRDVGLLEDGVMGPLTTLALSRVTAGRTGPTLADPGGR
ncbi:MAG: AAA family ATPase [Candidatus Rokubacteria bacterium]|nr:AAA family ATPase [Candidatus Rokubacteria bacterium]